MNAPAASSRQVSGSSSSHMPLATPTTGVASDDTDDTATGTISTTRFHAHDENIRAMNTLYSMPSVADVETGCHVSCSSTTAAAAIGTPAISIIQPVNAAVGIGSAKRLSSTRPSAHDTAAPSISTTPVTAFAMPPRSAPSRTNTPLIPRISDATRPSVGRSPSNHTDRSVLHSGIV